MIQKALKYLFPKLKARQKLPLLPLTYSVDSKLTIPAQMQGDVIRLKLAAVARTDHDAIQLLLEHRGMTVRQIIDKHKRHRMRSNKWVRALVRAKALWDR